MPSIVKCQSMYLSTDPTPSRASPLPHFDLCTPETPVATAPLCGERACPALGCAAAPKPATREYLKLEPLRSPTPHFDLCTPETPVATAPLCGERACPALGCAAAPKPATREYLKLEPLRSPTSPMSVKPCRRVSVHSSNTHNKSAPPPRPASRMRLQTPASPAAIPTTWH